MSEKTKTEVMAKPRRHYVNAGFKYRKELIDQAVAVMGFHRKSAIRSLNARGRLKPAQTGKAGRPARV